MLDSIFSIRKLRFPMLHYQTIPVTAFEQNCSVLWCDQTQEAAVVDPGGDLDRITGFIQRKGLQLKQILLTHAHIDHVGGTSAFRNAMVLASSVTSDLLDQEMPISAYKAFMPAFTRGFDELEAIDGLDQRGLVDLDLVAQGLQALDAALEGGLVAHRAAG